MKITTKACVTVGINVSHNKCSGTTEECRSIIFVLVIYAKYGNVWSKPEHFPVVFTSFTDSVSVVLLCRKRTSRIFTFKIRLIQIYTYFKNDP